MDLLKHFESAPDQMTLQAGEVLFSEGEPGTTMYVLTNGSASVIVADQVIEVVRPGMLLGEMALVDSSARSATVIAGPDCRVVSMDQAQFDALVAESPEFARHVITVIVRRLRHMNFRLKEALLSARRGWPK